MSNITDTDRMQQPRRVLIAKGEGERVARERNRRNVEIAQFRIYLVDYQEKLNDLIHELGLRHLIK